MNKFNFTHKIYQKFGKWKTKIYFFIENTEAKKHEKKTRFVNQTTILNSIIFRTNIES